MLFIQEAFFNYTLFMVILLGMFDFYFVILEKARCLEKKTYLLTVLPNYWPPSIHVLVCDLALSGAPTPLYRVFTRC